MPSLNRAKNISDSLMNIQNFSWYKVLCEYMRVVTYLCKLAVFLIPFALQKVPKPLLGSKILELKILTMFSNPLRLECEKSDFYLNN